MCRGPKVGPLTDAAGLAGKEESLGTGLVTSAEDRIFLIHAYCKIWFGQRLQEIICEHEAFLTDW